MRKKIITFLLATCLFLIGNNVYAKTIIENIKDKNPKLYAAIVKNDAIPNWWHVDGNGDGIYENDEITNYSGDLPLWHYDLDSIEGLEYFQNVTNLWLNQNNLTNVDTLLKMPKLKYVALAANNLNTTYHRDHSYLSTILELQNRGVSVGAAQQTINYDINKQKDAPYKYKILYVIVKDIDAEGELWYNPDKTSSRVTHTLSDDDIKLAKEWGKLLEKYIEKETNYQVDAQVDIYVTHDTFTEFNEDSHGDNMGKDDWAIYGRDIPEIASILEDYDSSIVIAHLNEDLHVASTGGFDGKIKRGIAWFGYDEAVKGLIVNNESIKDEIEYTKKDKSINGYLDGIKHEFIHTVEFYSMARSIDIWEFHAALRSDNYNYTQIQYGDYHEKHALYMNGYVNPENSSEKGISTEIWSNPPTKYYTTTLTAPDKTTVSINTDQNKSTNTLTWNQVPNTTVYKLLRSDVKLGTYEIVYFGTDTNYVDKNLEEGVTYYYKVVAVNTSGIESARSEDSNIVAGKINIKKITVAPTVTVTDGNNNRLVVKWNKVEAATKYEVYRSTTDSNYTKIATTTDLTYTDKDLTYGQVYYYKVKAINDSSTKTSSSANRKVVPNTPNNFGALAGNKKVQLDWDYMDATGYDIYYSKDNKTFTFLKTITYKDDDIVTYHDTFDVYEVTNLEKNTLYYFKIRAFKKVSGKKVYSAFTNSVKARTAPKTPTISVTKNSYNTIDINVKAVKNAVKYQIFRSTSKNGTYKRIAEITTAGTYHDKTVLPGTTYYYVVRACNGYSACGTLSAIGMNKSIVETPKVTLTKDASSATFTWNKTIDGAKYQIFRSTSKNGKYTKVGSVTGLNYKDENLIPGKTYYYKIRTLIKINGKNYYSNYTEVISVTPKVTKVTGLKVKLNKKGLKLYWQEIPGITNYQIFRSEKENGTYKKVGTISNPSFLDTTTKSGKTYYYIVRAYVKNNGKLYYGKFSLIKSNTFK